jgi:hypothetical protein
MSLKDCIDTIGTLSEQDIAFLEAELAEGKTDAEAIKSLEALIQQATTELVGKIEEAGGEILREGDPEALRVKSILNQEAEDKKWSRWRPGETSTGKINGAPEWVNNSKDPKKALAKMERELNNRLKEGLVGRMWYEESTRRIIDITNGNLIEAEMLIQIIAIYSPQATVQVNTGFAVKAWNQYKRNEPITASGNQSKDGKATAVLYEGKPFAGRKTSSFYQNLMYELLAKNPKAMEILSLDQEIVDSLDKPATIDLWMARAFGYTSDALGDDKGSGKYSFSENYLRRITARMNKRLEPGQPRWTPHQVQAAVWTSMKARYELPHVKLATNRESTRKGLSVRKGAGYERIDSTKATQQKHNKIWRKWAATVTGAEATEFANTTAASFETFLDQMTEVVTWEVMPSTSLNQPITTASPTAQAQFHRDALRIIMSDDGSDQLASMLGIPLNYVRSAHGAYDNVINENYLSHLIPEKGQDGFTVEQVREYARAIQYIFKQDAVPWFRADPRAMLSKAAQDQQLFRVIKTSTGRTVSKGKFENQMEAEEFLSTKAEGHEIRGGKYAYAQAFSFKEKLSPQGREHVLKSLQSVLGPDAGFTMTAPNEVSVINFRDPETGMPFLDDQKFDLAIDEVTTLLEGRGLVEVLDFWSEGEYGHVQDYSADPEGTASLEAGGFTERPDLQAWIRGRREQYERLLEDYSTEGIKDREVEARQSDYLAQRTAYHGTGESKTYSRFSTDYIGGGKGVGQYNFGWGLYFTDTQDIAENYRKWLSENRHSTANESFQANGQPLDEFVATLPVDERKIFDSVIDNYMDGLSRGILDLDSGDEFSEEFISQIDEEFWYPEDDGPWDQGAADMLVSKIEELHFTPEGGALYKVALAPQEDEFMNWDMEVDRQPQKVQDIIAKATDQPIEYWVAIGFTGGNVYEMLARNLPGGQKEASLTLLALGIKGMKYRDASNAPWGSSSNYVVFDGAQVEIIDRLSQSAVWYSALQRAAKGLQQKKGSGKQMLAMLKKQPGVKAEELEWLGVDDYLAGTDSVTREEIQQFIEQGGVEVNDVTYGGSKADALHPLRQDYATATLRAIEVVTSLDYLGKDTHEEALQEIVSNDRWQAYNNVTDTNSIVALKRFREMHEEIRQAKNRTEVKYRQYTLPGGADYREMVLTLPDQHKTGPTAVLGTPTTHTLEEAASRLGMGVEDFSGAAEVLIYDRSLNYIQKMADGDYWTIMGIEEFTSSNLAEVESWLADQVASELGEDNGTNYRSSHWQEPNVIAHIRFNTREIDGKNTLFIEEIQSDWHQAGRRARTAEVKRVAAEDGISEELAGNIVPANFGYKESEAKREARRKELKAKMDALDDQMLNIYGPALLERRDERQGSVEWVEELDDAGFPRLTSEMGGNSVTVEFWPNAEGTEMWRGLLEGTEYVYEPTMVAAQASMEQFLAEQGNGEVVRDPDIWTQLRMESGPVYEKMKADELVELKMLMEDRDSVFIEYERTDAARNDVPDGPFKKTWPLLSMKRMIRYAVENGFDQVAWTSGEQQAQRYSQRDERAEGMAGFYDKMLPNQTSKYIKKMGGEVHMVPMQRVEPEVAQAIQEFATFAPTHRISIEVPQHDRDHLEHFALEEGETVEWDHAYVEPYYAHGDLVAEYREEGDFNDAAWFVYDPSIHEDGGEFEWADGPFETEEDAQIAMANFFSDPESTGNYNTIVPLFREVNGQVEVQELGMIYYEGTFGDSFTNMTWRSVELTPYGQNPDFRGPTAEDAMIEDAMPTVGEQNDINVAIDRLLDRAGVTDGVEFAIMEAHVAISTALGTDLLIQEDELHDLMDQFDQTDLPRGNGIDAAEERDNAIVFFTDGITDHIVRRRRHDLATLPAPEDFVPTQVGDPRVDMMTDAEFRSMLVWNDSNGEFDGATRAEMAEIYHSNEMEDPEGTQSLYDLYVERTGFQPAAAQLPAPQFAPMRTGYSGQLPMNQAEFDLIWDGLIDAMEAEGHNADELINANEFDYSFNDETNQFEFENLPLWLFEYLGDIRNDVVPGTEFQNLIEPVAEGQELLPAPEQGDPRRHRGEIERGVFPQEELSERMDDMLFNIANAMEEAGLDGQDYNYGRITNDDEGDYFEFIDVPTQVLSIIANAADDAGLNAALRIEMAPVVLGGGAAQAQLPAPVDQPVELLGAEVSDAVESFARGDIDLDEFSENIGIETNPRVAAWHTAINDIASFNMEGDPDMDETRVMTATNQILEMAAAGGPPRTEIPTAVRDTMIRNAQAAITLEEGTDDQIAAHNELLLLAEDVLSIDWDYHAFYTQDSDTDVAVRYATLIINQHVTDPLPIPGNTPAMASAAVLTQAINPEFAIDWPFTITGLTDWYTGWLESQELPPTSADELQGLTQPQRLIVDEFITRWEQAQSREDTSNIPRNLMEMIQAERGHDHIYFWDNAHINPVVDDSFALRVVVESDIEGDWMGGTLHVNFSMSQPPADRQQPAEINAAIENPDNEITINDISVGDWMTDQDEQTVWGDTLQPIAPLAPVQPALPRPVRQSPMVHAFDITDEMRATATEGQALFQDENMESERGRFFPDVSGERIIQLTEASDLSSFLHEGAHLYLDVQRVWVKKYGMGDNQKAMLKWLGARDFDSISIDQHETWAETFEVYLREGKAPSVGLRRAFTSFASWLKRIYTTLADPRLARKKLDPEITEIFDRLLATQEEIDMAALRPEYGQLFQSKEQAGMTDEQWARYQQLAEKKKETAEMTLDEKVIKQYKKMKSEEWKEEKAPLAAQEAERIGQEPVYQLLSEAREVRDDKGRVVSDGRVDWHKLKDAIGGGLPSGKLQAVGGGVDPGLYSDKYGFASVKDMYEQIKALPNLKDAADQAAEQIMVAKYGDLLNDGTLETEVREAMLNEEQAEQVIQELKAAGTPKGQRIDRATLKFESEQLIGTMTYKEIRPAKFYNAMIKAAKKSVTAEDPTNDKIQQLANHYLYRAAMDAKSQMDKDRKKVRAVQGRKYNPLQVDQQYIEAMKSLANAYDMRMTPEERTEFGRRVLDFYEGQTNPENENSELFGLEMLDPNLVAAIRHRHENGNLDGFVLKTFDEMTVEEMGGVTNMLDHLRYVGGQVANKGNTEAAAIREAGVISIEENGGKDYGVQRGKQRKLKQAKLTWGDTWASMPSLGNMVRKLDGFNDGGWAFKNILTPLQDAIDLKFRMQNEMFDQMRTFLAEMPIAGLRKDDAVPFTKENGEQADFSSEEVFMMAVYWGTDSSREALMQGHELTEGDVQRLLQQLTVPQLELVNQIWAMNESQWPALQEAAKAMLGVAPPKLQPAPFNVNGVELTGGHMQLMYDSQALELADEQARGMNTSNVVPMQAGSTHARKGSGGRPVLLDTQNITQSMEDKTHYIAFAEAGRAMRGILNSKEIQLLIEKKHGAPFYDNMVHGVAAVMRAEPARETSRWLARLSRWTRQSATLMHLGYSLRNVMQQFPAALISAREVGPIKFAQASGLFASNPRKMMDSINEKSAKMQDRKQLINRDSREALKQVLATSKGEKYWEQFKSGAFVLQTMVDSTVAYPTWYAKYTDSMEKHGDERRAVIEADAIVAETVGSGHDVYLGRIMQSNQNELVKTLTMFGSWFNAYYQRLYKSSKAGTDFLSIAFALDAVVMPIIVANLTQLVIGDWPDDDEEIEDYIAKNSLGFMVATMPVLRDLGSLLGGFTPSTPISAIPAAAVRIQSEIASYGKGNQTGLKTIADLGRAVSSVTKLPGSGNVWRLLEYWGSFNEGNEGDVFNPYLALTEGADKDK